MSRVVGAIRPYSTRNDLLRINTQAKQLRTQIVNSPDLQGEVASDLEPMTDEQQDRRDVVAALPLQSEQRPLLSADGCL